MDSTCENSKLRYFNVVIETLEMVDLKKKTPQLWQKQDPLILRHLKFGSMVSVVSFFVLQPFCVFHFVWSLLLRLVLPTVRASIENACARVARGEAQKPRVVEMLGKHWNEMWEVHLTYWIKMIYTWKNLPWNRQKRWVCKGVSFFKGWFFIFHMNFPKV